MSIWTEVVLPIGAAIVLGVLFVWGIIHFTAPDPKVQYKINKCVTSLPPQFTQPLERCTAAVALEGER